MAAWGSALHIQYEKLTWARAFPVERVEIQTVKPGCNPDRAPLLPVLLFLDVQF
jgi:hypothetical protein